MELPKVLLEPKGDNWITEYAIEPITRIKESRVFVCGDTHGSDNIKKLNTTNWKVQKELTKDDHLIILGDMSNPWSCGMREDVTSHEKWDDVTMSKDDKYWLDWLAYKNYTTLVLLGNHEGVYNIIKYIPKTYYEPIKGYVKELKLEHGVIRFLMRDSEYYINGRRFLVIGGALSIDKVHRIPNVSWWEEELLTTNEQDNILCIINKDNKFDYILSHTCPSWLIPEFVDDVYKIHDPVSKFLERVENMTEFTQWHFGHMHKDKTFKDTLGNHFQCHLNNEPLELLL